MVCTIRIYKRKPRKEEGIEVKPKTSTEIDFGGLKFAVTNPGEKSLWIRQINGWW